jgi:hypothetical protein
LYHTVIEAVGGNDQVKANYLTMTLSSAARSWLSNLLEGTIYNWDRLCAMFTGNIQGTYEQEHDESLWDYVKCFCNARNAIPNTHQIEPGRRMNWPDTDILFGLEDHPKTELSNQNLSFMVKLPIGRHNMAKTVIDNGVSLNLIMRKMFIEMGLSLLDLTPVHDMFNDFNPGQSSTPIGRINLEVSCVSGDNKHREMLTFEVASFGIDYNCILGIPFLLKFMTVIHTAYTIMEMLGL